jgi:polyhydroxyalkanoate synthesis regulator phasin
MMPKKKKPETQEEQSERFRAAVRQMIADGELNPTEADEAFDRLMKSSALRKLG